MQSSGWSQQCRVCKTRNLFTRATARWLTSLDNRNRLSNFWAPTSNITAASTGTNDSSTLLSRAGLIRQSGAGIFHLLPLGLRVQQKIESLIDKHMRNLGASKVSLSSITSEALWTRSGRFNGHNPEIFRLADQKAKTGQLLSPTHEEEITEIIRGTVKSYRDLPLRLYQISRKYRNELRPRQGLLRAREFLMKDLYTFDADEQSALQTYNQVKAAYIAFLDEFKIPYLIAQADSGDMGGDLSHEFHYASDAGEDTLLSCGSCGFVANSETTGQTTNCPQCGLAGLHEQRAVEIGHVFHLGTRYSLPLDANVALAPRGGENSADAEHSNVVPIQMGCHGVGISRLIGAITSILADEKGLNWPRKVAPFEVLIAGREGFERDAERAYDSLAGLSVHNSPVDVLLDDRNERVSWKLHDADLIGYPVIVVLGKAWKEKRMCEVQCRRLNGLRENVAEADLQSFIAALLERL